MMDRAKNIANYLDTVAKMVHEHGWMCQAVSAGEGDPPFVYTIGLHATFGHPEIIIVGLNFEQGHAILHGVVAKIRDGQKFATDMLVPEIINKYDVAIRPIPVEEAAEHTGVGQAFQPGGFDTVQLFVPDIDGRFPWDAGSNSELAKDQLALFGDVLTEPFSPEIVPPSALH